MAAIRPELNAEASRRNWSSSAFRCLGQPPIRRCAPPRERGEGRLTHGDALSRFRESRGWRGALSDPHAADAGAQKNKGECRPPAAADPTRAPHATVVGLIAEPNRRVDRSSSDDPGATGAGTDSVFAVGAPASRFPARTPPVALPPVAATFRKRLDRQETILHIGISAWASSPRCGILRAGVRAGNPCSLRSLFFRWTPDAAVAPLRRSGDGAVPGAMHRAQRGKWRPGPSAGTCAAGALR